jgi:hypothetical protein
MEMTAEQWADKIWESEGALSEADAPEAIRGQVVELLAAMERRNTEACRAIAASYHAIVEQAIDAHAAAAGETVISLMPLDVGFDVLSLHPPQSIELPDTPGVLTVVIPAGRIPAGWEKDYPANIRTEGSKTRVRSKHRDFVCEMLRIAGYRVKGYRVK